MEGKHMTVTRPTFHVGSVEYLTVTVKADETLDQQPVSISVDRGVTWLPAVWEGDAGTTRAARTAEPITWEVAGWRPVHVKVIDNPEVPIVAAGSLTVSK